MTTADMIHRKIFLSPLIGACDPLSAASCSQWRSQPPYRLIGRGRTRDYFFFTDRHSPLPANNTFSETAASEKFQKELRTCCLLVFVSSCQHRRLISPRLGKLLSDVSIA